MSGRVHIDNWLLQDVGDLLCNGLDGQETGTVIVDRENNFFSYNPINYSNVQLDGLFALLSHIVLRDSLIVDAKFTGAWGEFDSVGQLREERLIIPKPFLADPKQLVEPRNAIVEKLCVTDDLKEEQRLNEEAWAKDRSANNRFLSALIWGTAGLLARTCIDEAPYFGHPLRQHFLKQTAFYKKTDAVSYAMDEISSARAKLWLDGPSRGIGVANLPPVVVEVIESSSKIEDLIPTAIELRGKYKRLRKWLNEFQHSVECGDTLDEIKFRRTLKEVTREAEKSVGESLFGEFELSLGYEGLSLSVPLKALSKVHNKIGIRGQMTKMIFSQKGTGSLKKLLGWFGEKDSSIGIEALQYFSTK